MIPQYTTPPFLLCRECEEIPGCETILDTQTLDLARIHRFDREADFDSYHTTHNGPTFIHAYVEGYRIAIEATLNLSVVNMLHKKDEEIRESIQGMAAFFTQHIAARPNKFKKFKII